MVCSQSRGVQLPLVLLTPLPDEPPTPSYRSTRPTRWKQAVHPGSPSDMAKGYCYSCCGDEEIEAQGSGVHSSVHALIQRFTGGESWENRLTLSLLLCHFQGSGEGVLNDSEEIMAQIFSTVVRTEREGNGGKECAEEELTGAAWPTHALPPKRPSQTASLVLFGSSPLPMPLPWLCRVITPGSVLQIP